MMSNNATSPAINTSLQRIADRFVTHEVTNQATPLADYNAYSTDTALIEAIVSQNAAWAAKSSLNKA
jgi:hypothetical protein